MRVPVYKNCLFCKNPFRVKPSHYNGKSYCCRACMAKDYKARNKDDKNPNYKGGISKPREAICVGCGIFYMAKKKGRDKYCSVKCFNSKQRGPQQSDEYKQLRYSAAYKEWRFDVLERDNKTCCFCGVRNKVMHTDHIKPFALFPELRLSVDNGRTLCAKCHYRRHRELFKVDHKVFE